MDNLSCQKVKRVVEAIEAAGAQTWYLPPYSRDLNPIDQLWSKVKTILRPLARRSIPILYRAIGTAIKRVTQQECTNYSSNYEYPLY